MHLCTIISGVIFVAAVSFICDTNATLERNVFCSKGNITGVRIEGCEKEPCIVKKGVKIPIEVDFYFEAPASTDEIEFRVFVPYWNVPDTGVFGSHIAEENSCENFQIKSCPAVALSRYTLKTQLYAEPKLQNTLGHGSTGEVNTSWILSPENEGIFAHCLFEVLLNITE